MKEKENLTVYVITYLNSKGRKMTATKSGTSREDAVRAFHSSTKFKYIVLGVKEK